MSAMLQRRRSRRSGPRSRGQALVEFALIFPIFMLVLFGIIDVGRFVYVSNSLNEASREGARYGSVEQWQYSCPASVGSPDRFTCTSAVTLGRLAGAPANVAATVTCETVGAGGVLLVVPAAANCGQNDLLIVQAKAPSFQFLTPGIALILGTPTIFGLTQAAIQ
jgi:Flp pilus assembly protein TadG